MKSQKGNLSTPESQQIEFALKEIYSGTYRLENLRRLEKDEELNSIMLQLETARRHLYNYLNNRTNLK